jgi:hypothetical protein
VIERRALAEAGEVAARRLVRRPRVHVVPFHPLVADQVAVIGLLEERLVREQLVARFDETGVVGPFVRGWRVRPRVARLAQQMNRAEGMIRADLTHDHGAFHALVQRLQRHAQPRDREHPAVRRVEEKHPQVRRQSLREEFAWLAPCDSIDGRHV